MAPDPLRKLLTRSSCDHSLTSYDVDHDDFCAPITECACDEPWFYPVLILGIILLCLSTCCCVKALRPKPGKDGFLAHGFMEKTPVREEDGWYGKGWGSGPARISRDGGMGGNGDMEMGTQRGWHRAGQGGRGY